MNGLRVAFGFLTVLPVPGGRWEPARAVAWYPVVGVVLGAAAGASAFAAFEIAAPPLAATLTIAVWVVLTGGLHLDGLADTADAAFAPMDRERRLAILRDVHHGTFATVAVALVLLLKFGALAAMDGRTAAAAVALSIVAPRAALPLVMRTFPRGRDSGLGATSRPGATPIAVIAGAATALAAGTVTFGVAGAGMAVGTTVLGLSIAAWLRARFGGLTGDCYGAIVECAEAAALIAASMLVTNGHAAAFPAGRWL